MPGDAVVCEALAQMWSRLGLTVNAQALNGTVFFPASANEEYTMSMSAWGTLTGEAAYTYGALAHTKDDEAGFGGFNRTGYSNPESSTASSARARRRSTTRSAGSSMRRRPRSPWRTAR